MDKIKVEKVVRILTEWTEENKSAVLWTRRFDLDTADAVDNIYTAEVLDTQIGVMNRILIPTDVYGKLDDSKRVEVPSFVIYDEDIAIVELSEKSGITGVKKLMRAVEKRFAKADSFFDLVISTYEKESPSTNSY